jgi:LPS-assembly protein
MHRIWFLALLVWLTASAAHAQGGSPVVPAAPGTAAPTPAQRFRIGNFDMSADQYTNTSNTISLRGNAQITISADSSVFGDEIDIDIGKSMLTASGNVVLHNPEGTISATRIELDIEQGTGTFHVASGVMSLGADADPMQFGGQDPDVYFTGQKIERLGPRRYRITQGSFTTCVQPEPRWQMVSTSLEINLNDYAIARNTVLRVKGVPVLYLPFLYYPIQDDERATGFLMPTYGGSRLRGQALSNGFFWAIGRSHDATFAHDWFSKAGHGYGGEYRYVASPGSSGDIRVRRFHQKQATYDTDGTSRTIAAGTSFELTGSAVHAITPTIRARARVDYASDIISQQLYQQNLVRATNPVRAIEGAVSGNWGALSTNVSYQRTELFTSEDHRLLYGSTPRVTAALAPQRLFGLPIYGAVNSEYAHLPYQDIQRDTVLLDKSLSRVDLNPSIRIPLSGLTFLTVNSNAAFRSTYYTKSADPARNGLIVPEPLLRTFLSLRSDVVGPVFNKIWDTPDSARAERRKHVIEPAFSVDYVSPIEAFTRVPVLSDYSDVVVGSTTRMTYGLTNRLFSRSRPDETGRGQAREVLTVGIQQTYYSNEEAGQFDSSYQSAFGIRRAVMLSPIALTARVMPATGVETNGRLEYDVSGNGLQLMSAGASANGIIGSLSANYSWRHINQTVDADNYVSASGSVRLREGRVNTTYGLSWDIGRGYVVSQTAQLSYMAQCCGLQVEFQQFNYPESVGIPLSSDRRINFGVVLSGLGSISNFFGAFGGQ